MIGCALPAPGRAAARRRTVRAPAPAAQKRSPAHGDAAHRLFFRCHPVHAASLPGSAASRASARRRAALPAAEPSAFCDLAHSMNCWNRRSCSAGLLGAALAACARTIAGSICDRGGGGLLVGVLGQPLLGRREALPAAQRGGEVGLLPLDVARRLLEFGELGEEGVDEQRDAAIAVGVRAASCRRRARRDGDGVDRAALGDQVGVVVVGELGREIVLLERLACRARAAASCRARA